MALKIVKTFIELRLPQLFFKWQLLKQRNVIVRSASATSYLISAPKMFCPFQVSLTLSALAVTARMPLVAI